MKDLTKLTVQELEDFFNSFDTILSDINGVLRNVLQEIPGSVDAVNFLKKMDKQCILVTNATPKSVAILYQELKEAGFNVEKDEIVTPTSCMISYLEKQDLDEKKVFVLGSPVLKQALGEAGFVLEPNGPDRIKDSVQEFATLSVIDDGSVGVVIADADFNLNYLNLQKAATFLERPEVIFVSGPTDVTYPVGANRILMGPGIFVHILEKMTKRTAIKMAKPSPYLNEYIVEKYQIKDPSRVLFIGDSIPEDMGFAGNCGYKKLLVLSGLEKKSALKDWKYDEKWKPDFYVESLKQMHELTLRLFGK